MDHSPANYPSSDIGLQISHGMSSLDPNEQYMTLPILMENLRIDARPSNPIISPIPAAITAMDYSSEYMLRLRSFLQPKGVLEEIGYIVQQLSESAIERKKKCKRCGKGKYITGRAPYHLVTNGYSYAKRQSE